MGGGGGEGGWAVGVGGVGCFCCSLVCGFVACVLSALLLLFFLSMSLFFDR